MAETKATRRHRGWVTLLVVLGAIVLFLSSFALWAKRQLLETNTWADTSSKLLENEDIRTEVAGFLVDTLFSQADVQGEIEQALPPRAAPAAGVIAGAIRNAADDLAVKALERPKAQQLWEEANRNAHKSLLQLVKEGGDQDVTLDVGALVDQLGDQVGLQDAASKLPPDAAQITILHTDDLQAAQDAIDLLEALAWALLVLALLLFAAAIYLAAGWRREALRSVGIAFIAVGIAVLVVRDVAGNILTDKLADTASVEPAISATWSIATSLLTEIGGAGIFYGIVIVLGTWLAGPTGLGRSARRAIAPVLHERRTAYAALLVVLLLLFWWAPTPGFQRVLPSILLIVLSVIGLEALRGQAIRDFPDETWEAGAQRWRDSGRSLLDRRSKPDQ